MKDDNEAEQRTLGNLAWNLLAYAGYQVCQEVFAEFLATKKQKE